jgi:DNA-binding response OmpR family regulator
MGYNHLVIGVTGNALDSDVAEFEKAGADMVLTKPVNMGALEKLLKYCHSHGCRSHNRGTNTLVRKEKCFFLSFHCFIFCCYSNRS